MSVPSQRAHGGNPFKFLESFGEDEGGSFFGRERETAALAARISASRMLVLYGRSGVGKTSLVRAGLVPALRARRFLPIYARLFQRPLADLLAQVSAAVCAPVREAPRSDPAKPPKQASLVTLLRYGQKKSGREPVLVLDQLEELFVRFPDAAHPERAAVLEALREAMTDRRCGARFLFSLRQDFVAELDDLDPGLGDLLDNRFRLRGLSAFGARQAALQPLRREHIDFSPKLAQRLVDALAAHAYEPVVLQIVASELFGDAMARHPERREITIEDLSLAEKEAANAEGQAGRAPSLFDFMLSRYLDRLARATPSHLHLVVRAVLDAMITRAGTKRALTPTMLFEALGIEASVVEIAEALSLLEDNHVVRRDDRAGEAWFEPLHDRLVERLRPWLLTDRTYLELRFARQLVQQLASSPVWRESPDALLGRGQLDTVIGPQRDRLRLSAQEREMLVQSAIVSGSPSLRFWAEKHGAAATSALVISLFGHRGTAVRVAAARAAVALSGEARSNDASLVAACLQAAIRDPDAAVRQAAGASFVAVAPDSAAPGLREARMRVDLCNTAMEVLILWLAARRSPEALTPEQVDTARRIASERALVARRDDIELRAQKSRKHSLLAALGWFASVGVVLSLFTAWTAVEGDDWLAAWVFILGAGAVVVAILGALIGPALARIALRAELAPEPPRIWRSMLTWRTGFPFFLLLGALIVLLCAVGTGYDWVVPSLLVGLVQLGITCFVLDLVQRSSAAFARWPAAFIHLVGPLSGAGLSMAVSVPYLVLTPAASLPAAYLVPGCCAIVCSATISILLRSLAASGARMAVEDAAPSTSPRALAALLLAGLGAIALLGTLVRIGATPYFAPTVLVSEPAVLRVAQFPPTRLRYLKNATPDLAFVLVDADNADVRLDGQVVEDPGLVIVPPGEHEIRSTPEDVLKRASTIRLMPAVWENEEIAFTQPSSRNGTSEPQRVRILRVPLVLSNPGEGHEIYHAHLDTPVSRDLWKRASTQVVLDATEQRWYPLATWVEENGGPSSREGLSFSPADDCKAPADDCKARVAACYQYGGQRQDLWTPSLDFEIVNRGPARAQSKLFLVVMILQQEKAP